MSRITFRMDTEEARRERAGRAEKLQAQRPIRIQIVAEEPDPEEALEQFQKFFTQAAEPPFRDPESAGYFREVIRGEMDDDWYSIPTPEHDKVWDSPRMAFCDLNNVHKIALLLINNSRKGIYTPFQLAGRIDDNAWPYMASLPFDILICLQRMSSWGHFSREVEYLVSNYCYKGKEMELTVTGRVSLSEREEDEFFTELEPHIMYGAGYGLCIGKDGKYYMDTWDFKRATEYYWLNDIPDTIAHLEAEQKKTEPFHFMGEAKEYSLLDYAKLSLRSPFRLSRMSSASRAFGEEDETEWICSVSSGEFGMEESEFPDIETFKVINQLYSLPDVQTRKPVLFLVDRHADGSWSLGQTMTVKYPEFDELLAQVVCELRTPDPERYILVVDSDEKLYGPDDFKDTICGFLLKQNSLEVLQKEIALKRFADALRRAESSGRYEIRNKWEDE
ncbi:MAG: hypothetical protein LUG93_01095 [Lachnospiraceae bacterium]|nr:hypothetical protein [Lachnospiraceae bacterium]